MPRFYHEDVAGHHLARKYLPRRHRGAAKWGQANFKDPVYDIRDIVADEDKFAAIRFVYACTLVSVLLLGEIRHGGHIFYRISGRKISEFWLLSDADFDYKQRP